MKKLLIVVDMQNDFIDGSLGTKEAVAIVPNVVKKIKGWDGEIIATQDSHFDDYLEIREGKNLPVKHCIVGTEGHKINNDVLVALFDGSNLMGCLNKYTFGSTALPDAMLLKANYPEVDIAVDAACCAGVTPETHKAALETMKMCQIKVIGE